MWTMKYLRYTIHSITSPSLFDLRFCRHRPNCPISWPVGCWILLAHCQPRWETRNDSGNQGGFDQGDGAAIQVCCWMMIIVTCCWLMVVGWRWLMMVDDGRWWLMLVDDGWCWLTVDVLPCSSNCLLWFQKLISARKPHQQRGSSCNPTYPGDPFW